MADFGGEMSEGRGLRIEDRRQMTLLHRKGYGGQAEGRGRRVIRYLVSGVRRQRTFLRQEGFRLRSSGFAFSDDPTRRASTGQVGGQAAQPMGAGVSQSGQLRNSNFCKKST
jgi:hypothetical protein